jgi:hypothetical protein
MRRDLLWFVSVRTPDAELSSAVAAGLQLAALFLKLFPAPIQFRSAALLAFFPDLAAADAGEFIDGGHRRLRMDFVRRGLMLGEFHPGSQVTSVRNAEFPVMRCPVPMYAVRALTVHDLMFLDQPGEKPARRMEYLQHFLHHVGAELSPAVRAEVELTITRLRATA